jgi:predicted DNA-binding transcriptional regulator AlpA
MNNSNDDRLINHREVAKILGIHPGSVHRYVSNGLIPDEAYIRLPSGARQTGNTPNGRGNMIRFWHSKILKVQEDASRKGNLGIGQEEGRK